MKLLVLGGTHHVGRAIVEAALERGDEVSTLNRGISRQPAPGVRALIADRTNPECVRRALRDEEWDAVIDTWVWAPRMVRESAVLECFGARALLARAGMILGPYEDVGRIPWWLRRLEKGGRVLAPAPAETPLQYLDVRDLAAWMLQCAERGLAGAFTVTGPPGAITLGELLTTALEVTGFDAELVWADPDLLVRHGLPLGMELGLRLPDGSVPSGMHDADVSTAPAEGLTTRPLRESLADIWLDAAAEQQLLDQLSH